MRHVLRRRRLKRIIVTLKMGKSFVGALWQHDRDALVLRNATAIGQGDNGGDVAVDGEVILLRSEIDFIQRP